MDANVRAWELRRQLFELLSTVKNLGLELWAEERYEASEHIDAVGCKLAEVYESLPDFFIDAARDKKDQLYAAAEGV